MRKPVIEDRRFRFYRPWLYLEHEDWATGYSKEGHYYGLITIRVSLQNTKNSQHLFLIGSMNGYEYSRKIAGEFTSHQIKLACAKFIKYIYSNEIKPLPWIKKHSAT